MAVSGTNTFSVTRDQVIEASLRLLGVIGVGETPIQEDYTNCSQALNIMIKSWAKKGWPLWVVQQLEIPMQTGITAYPIGLTAGYISSVTITDGGTGYAASGTVTFTGGGGTGATGTYTSTDGVIDAITITNGGSAYTSAPTVSFSGAGSGATGTAIVVGLTTNKPVRAFSGFVRDANDNDTVLQFISKEEYDSLGDKSSQGVPNQIYYDNQLANAVMYVYTVPSSTDYTVFLDVQRMFYDMSTSTDDFDFPQEWFQAIKWGLAAELAIEYGVEAEKIAAIEQKAMMYVQECFDFSVEEASVYFQLDMRG
jgi:hypothetical protein